MASSREPDRYYVLLGGRESEYDTEMLEADPVNLGEAPTCEVCGRFVGGKAWLPPHRAELTLHGSVWGDFAFRVGDETDALVIDTRARDWREAGLVGLSGFEPVEITRVQGSSRPAPQYLHVAVKLGGAVIDEARSSIVRAEEVTCEECRYAGILSAINGFSLETGTWTGEDVFIPRGLSGTVVVTPRFKEWIETNAVTNVCLTPTEAYEWDSMVPISGPR
jgi:hypothetical protein